MVLLRGAISYERGTPVDESKRGNTREVGGGGGGRPSRRGCSPQSKSLIDNLSYQLDASPISFWFEHLNSCHVFYILPQPLRLLTPHITHRTPHRLFRVDCFEVEFVAFRIPPGPIRGFDKDDLPPH